MGIYQQADVWSGTATATITSSPAILFGFHVGTDGSNDPTITVYNGTAVTTDILIATSPYEADYKGLNGIITPYSKKAYNGIHIVIANLGTGVVVVDYRTLV